LEKECKGESHANKMPIRPFLTRKKGEGKSTKTYEKERGLCQEEPTQSHEKNGVKGNSRGKGGHLLRVRGGIGGEKREMGKYKDGGFGQIRRQQKGEKKKKMSKVHGEKRPTKGNEKGRRKKSLKSYS